ncbi:MAG: hypothetical protein IKG55_06235, partial [Solobacterium sp.]|nr:hypothetical protein [Solobacterium sp.]
MVQAEETPNPGNSSHVQETTEKKGTEGKTPDEEKDSDGSETGSTALNEETPDGQKNVRAYDLWVSGVRVNEENKSDILKDGTASYEENGNILTLKNAKLEVKNLIQEAGEALSAAIYAKDELTIRITGKASIKQSEEQPDGNEVAGILIHAQTEKTLRI